MYRNYQMPNTSYRVYNRPMYQNNNRLIGGGFAAPFLLGGITGAVLTPYFYRPYPPRPYPYPPMYYPPYPPRPF